jgi:NAD(P)-dependent dehydrogenase (short-subunit alcohol dehydrogenase family)
LRVDVRQAGDLEDAAWRITDEVGGTDVLCNNAGVLAAPRPVWETPREDAEWVFSVNFWGAFNGVQAFVPRMLQRGTPSYVVNTSSMSAIVPMPISSSYAMSKSAVLALTEALHQDLRAVDAPIKVAVVLPEHFRSRLGSAHRNRASADDLNKTWNPVFAPGEDPMEHGADPAILGRRIVEAVRADKFWVLPTRTDAMAGPALDRLRTIEAAFL